MKLSQIVDDPVNSFDYMERLVNDGSPSGFTQKYTTSRQTNPKYSKGFYVKKLYPHKGKIFSYGKCVDSDFVSPEDHSIYIHPDWIGPEPDSTISTCHKEEILALGKISDGMLVVPTSSMRTVRVKGTNKFIKLQYPGMIGRIPRGLGVLQLSFAVKINHILNKEKQTGNFPFFFDFMPEYYGRVVKDGQIEIGFVCREMPKYDGISYYIPAFSLFSKDSHMLDDEVVLVQLLKEHSDGERLSFLLEEICYPLIDIFFYCAFYLGLIPEMHSQNIVFVFDTRWKTKKILLRDFESIDVDLTLREKLGIEEIITCPNNKAWTDKNDYYWKRHSYMYDHKLCEYLMDPLVKCAAFYLGQDSDSIVRLIQKYCVNRYGDQLKGFFPKDGCWYKYPNTEIDRSTSNRPYISMGKAKYR